MADVKDILGVPRAAGTPVEKAEAKPKKEKMKRPEGMSREAFALLGDSHPIITTQLVAKKKDMKAKPKPSTKGFVTWGWKPINSSARPDDLRIFHWSKAYKDAAGRVKENDDADYHFAKYNKKIQLMKYNDEEYEHLINPDSKDWSRHETDYLMDLCERFDLRFIVIHDRYDYVPPQGATAPTRSLDDLKERYYSIARRLLIAREGGESQVANHPLVRHPFNKSLEAERKKAVEALLQRTPQQAAEENAVLAEARVIEERWKAEAGPSGRGAGARGAGAAGPTASAAGAGAAGAAAGGAGSGAQSGVGAAGGAAAALQLLERRYPDSFEDFPPPTGVAGAMVGRPSLFNDALEPSKPPKPGVYPRAVTALHQANRVLQSWPGGQKAHKVMEAALNEPAWLGVPQRAPGWRCASNSWRCRR